jgi:hypothetical protein
MSHLLNNPTFNAISKGDYTNLPQEKSNLVRIFLSSTFSG